MTKATKKTTIVEQLGLPEKPHVIFKRSPLVLVVCQIKFTPVFSVLDAKFVAPFQRALQKSYPLASAANQINLQLGITPTETPDLQATTSQFWVFKDIEDTWTASLGPNFLAIETRRYEDFADFTERLKFLLTLLVKHIQPPRITRIGLRYINELRPDHETWTQIIRPEILGVLEADNFAQNTAVSVCQTQLRFDDGEGITMRYGLLPTGSTIEQREEELPFETPFYLLDFDLSKECAPQRALPLKPDTIHAHIEDYNKAIYQLFRWCVTDTYIATLEVRNDDDDVS